MSGYYPDGMTSRDLDGPVEFLSDKPRDRCPWCSHRLAVSDGSFLDKGVTFCGNVDCDGYHYWETVDENRIRYADGRLADAAIVERNWL